MMANFFKKKGGGPVATSSIQIMSDAEAALAQSDFNIEKITEIQNKFTGGMVLLYPGRIFIREGLLWKVCRKGPKKRQFFLFNDILVYGSVVANRFSNQHILPLAQMSVSAECYYQPSVDAAFDEDSEQMELEVSNAFQISHANKSFHVFALSSADKANWLANLHKHINKIAQSVSDDNQLVTKPVWVPDSVSKECMICSVKFTAFIRKHHCRMCGRVVCSACSPHRMAPNSVTQTNQYAPLETKKLERTCKDCFKDMSSKNSRLGGSQHQKPPTAAVAAQAVSSILQSASQLAVSSPVKQDHDSSTDTDDSDDSQDEKEELAIDSDISDGNAHMPISENESQPTPPPRKKKLRKKLELLVEQKLNENLIEGGSQSDNDGENRSDVKPVGSENTCHNTSASSAAEESNFSEEKGSPPKSRRKKKHMQAADTAVGRKEDNTSSTVTAGSEHEVREEPSNEIKGHMAPGNETEGHVEPSNEAEVHKEAGNENETNHKEPSNEAEVHKEPGDETELHKNETDQSGRKLSGLDIDVKKRVRKTKFK